MSLFFVFLRRPKDLTDRRNDPFWEFGSFGSTGCHDKNLLHPERSLLRDGDRLAFIQGGSGELKIVGLTPTIKVAGSTDRLELKWDRSYRPLPYVAAPLLINNDGETAFPAVFFVLKLHDTRRLTFCGRAASRLRARTTPVSYDLAAEMIRWFAPTKHPKITAYLQAIQAESGTWHRHALKQLWPSASQRARQYNGSISRAPAKRKCS